VIATEKKYRENLREIRRLQLRLATKAGRNVGATTAALDRRLEKDRRLLFQLAEQDES
jgi:hypothetical protein